ncbi:hypothetical protein ACFL5O_02380 [Myxococcota bacterium]
MLGSWLPLPSLAGLVSACCLTFLIGRWRRLESVRPDAYFGVPGLRGTGKTGARAPFLAWADQPMSTQGRELMVGILGAASRGEGVACLNEHLVQVESELVVARAGRAAATRIVLLSGGLLAVTGVAEGLAVPGWSPMNALSALAVAMVSAAVFWQIERLADARASSIRKEWDDWANAAQALAGVWQPGREEDAGRGGDGRPKPVGSDPSGIQDRSL